MDYGSISTILMFAACETQQCENISIVDNTTLEMTESFVVTLGRTPDLNSRITLNPVDGNIDILDSHGRKWR